MDTFDSEAITERSASEIRELVVRREISCEEATRSFLLRIERLEPSVEAWEFLEPEQALAEARSRDATAGDGPLQGVPIAVKDVFDTGDMPTSFGSPIYVGHQPSRDAECVAHLRSAGAIILGKTVTTEFAAVFEPAKTRNPLDARRTPGGSSSGSAAAVSAGMAPAAVGTQAGGSVVRPASYCGVFGFKPTFGLISRAGVKRTAESLDTVGVFARTVDDLLLQTRVLAGDNWTISKDGEAHADTPKIAVIKTGHWDVAEATAKEALLEVASRLADAGAEIEEAAFDPEFDELVAAATVVLQVEVANALASESNLSPEQFGEALTALIEQGRATPQKDYLAALKLADDWRDKVDARLADYSCALTLSVTGEPPPRNTTGDPIFCRTWTLLGTPEVSLPFVASPTGLPVGLQFVAARRADEQLLRATKWAAETFLKGGVVPTVLASAKTVASTAENPTPASV
jgi:Asp-tRNA(Asn)/Glu-tRNA(Gln) amidotransferase A subunit family amidase